jgi:hypothetical protein
MKVRFHASMKREVLNRNCVVATRGGEQRNKNGQSVTTCARKGGQRELDSVGGGGRACVGMAKPVGEGKTLWQWWSGMEKSPATRQHPADGWRRNGWKIGCSKQGYRARTNGVHAQANEPKNRPARSQSVHSSGEAGNDRGAKERRKVDG